MRLHELLEPVAARAIRRFFQDKLLPTDPRVAPGFLDSPRNVCLVLNTDLMDALKQLWRAWPDTTEERRIANAIQRQGGIAPKVQAVLDVLMECARKDVPKSWAGGMLLLCFELIHGVRLGSSGEAALVKSEPGEMAENSAVFGSSCRPEEN
jgi:hypothetical protein